ncbi:MAG: hypothetical protein Q8Q35_02555 [Nanoarchaeota archaeon]|nr:hypothetical protein [Nanoarchaeota archaeon]
MIQERVILCGRCNKSVAIGDVKYIARPGNMPIAMCVSCRNNWASSNKEKKPEVNIKEMRKVFLCNSCRYKFRFNIMSSSKVKCPFCGRADKLEEYRGDYAERLVRSV